MLIEAEIKELAEKKEYTKVFNYFHDELKDVIEDMHWSKKFREISGVSKEETDACYYRNNPFENIGVQLVAALTSLGL